MKWNKKDLERIEDEVRICKKILGLQEWEIIVNKEKGSEGDTYAEVIRDARNCVATLTVETKGMEDLEISVMHELLHLRFALVDRINEIITENLFKTVDEIRDLVYEKNHDRVAASLSNLRGRVKKDGQI